MHLFDDDLSRTNTTHKRKREPSFSFLNRSARPEFGRIRALIESWYEHFPAAARDDVRGRFRRPDEAAHAGALFELFVHELLIRLGARVEVHPNVSGTTTRPDFRADFEGSPVYVEAVTSNPPTRLSAPDPLEDEVLDAIDDLDSPNYFISVETSGKLLTAPPHALVVRPFAELMAKHDPDEVQRLVGARDFQAMPSREVGHEAWRLRGTLLPKSPTKRGDGSTRTIGAGPSRVGWVDSSTPVKDALIKKAGKYGEPDAPYVVAINAHDIDGQIDEMDALFGKEQFIFRTDQPDEPPEFSRQPDGVWIRGGPGPRYTRLAAVLLFRDVAPWSLSGAYGYLYLNPFTSERPPEKMLRLPHAAVRDGAMQWFEGEDIGHLFGLPEDWPGT